VRSEGRCYHRADLGAKPIRLSLIVLAAFTLAACGVSFSEEFEGTELFKTAWLTEGIAGAAGEVCAKQGATWVCRPGMQLSVNVGITNGYSVPVKVACYYEDPDAVTEDDEKLAFAERAKLIGETVLPAQDGRRPDTYAPTAGNSKALETLSFVFPAPERGKYLLVCLTPAAADNGIALTFKIDG